MTSFPGLTQDTNVSADFGCILRGFIVIVGHVAGRPVIFCNRYKISFILRLRLFYFACNILSQRIKYACWFYFLIYKIPVINILILNSAP